MTANLIYTALTDPESLTTKPATINGNLSSYRLAWAYYESRMFAPDADWTLFLSDRGLYKHTKLVFNPVPQVIDFYVDNIWSQAGEEKYPKLVTPIVSDNEDLINVVAQLDQWSNWRKSQVEVKQYAASTGNVLVEIIDDLERQKVTQQTVWAGFVSDIELNSAGDAQSYTVEYEVYDREVKETYQYKKIVTKESFAYFKNDKPFQYPGKEGVEFENPYGFCPAIWLKHSGGGTYGRAAFNDFTKVNHTNSLASHLHDNIHKEIESGKIIFNDNPQTVEVLSGGYKNRDGSISETDPRLDRVLLAMKGAGSVHDLSGLLKLAEAHPYLKDLIISFGADYPELEYRQIIKENAQMSGIALERLLTPAQNRLDRTAPNYDEQLIKLRQMQIAIAGWRTKNGWQGLTDQQRLFSSFGLESYERGELDFNLKSSRLIEQTEDEREDILTKKAARAASLADVVDRKEQLKVAGYTEDEIVEILTRFEQEQARKQIEAGQPAMIGGQPVTQLGSGLPIGE